MAETAYERAVREFRWDYPATINLGVEMSDRHAADPTRVAIIHDRDDGAVETYTFRQLAEITNRLANALVALGIRRGDRVAIILSQRPETMIAHIACYKMGAIVMPLSTLFGPDGLRQRLADAGAVATIVDTSCLGTLREIRADLGDLRHVIAVGSGGVAGEHDFGALLDRGSGSFEAVATGFYEPAYLAYTSGTTGPAKGALHGPCHIYAHVPGIRFTYENFPQPGDLSWTPNDWAWGGALVVCIYPSLLAGVPVVANRQRKFDPEVAFDILARHKVRNVILPPTALKLMRQVPDPRKRWDYNVRTACSGAETLGRDLISWASETLGVQVNELYGLTEFSLLTGNSHSVYEPRLGSMGRAIPGRRTEVVSPDGEVLPPGTQGIIAARRTDDPMVFLGYWKNLQATAKRFANDWFLTGDVGVKDEAGYFWFHGRDDDVIKSGGYRIGPSEIEECIMKHPSVSIAAVVGVPDKARGEAVKAFVLPKAGIAAGDKLADEIRELVRRRLAAYQYPREIEFVDALPMTTTGKIRRNELRERHFAALAETPR